LTFSPLTSQLAFNSPNSPRTWSPSSSFQDWWKAVIGRLCLEICHVDRMNVLFMRMVVVFYGEELREPDSTSTARPQGIPPPETFRMCMLAL